MSTEMSRSIRTAEWLVQVAKGGFMVMLTHIPCFRTSTNSQSLQQPIPEHSGMASAAYTTRPDYGCEF